MKNLLAFIMLAAALPNVSAQEWKLDKSHSSVNFSITHMMVSEVHGNFKDFSAVVKSGKDDFSDMNIDFTIQAASVNTGDEKRDEHLRGEDFFAADKFPLITFKSSEVSKTDDKHFKLSGIMTMKGISKKVSWDVKYNGTVKDNRGGKKAGFKGTAVIARKDFGVSWNRVLDSGGVTLSDDVEVVLNIELNQPAATK